MILPYMAHFAPEKDDIDRNLGVIFNTFNIQSAVSLVRPYFLKYASEARLIKGQYNESKFLTVVRMRQ